MNVHYIVLLTEIVDRDLIQGTGQEKEKAPNVGEQVFLVEQSSLQPSDPHAAQDFHSRRPGLSQGKDVNLIASLRECFRITHYSTVCFIEGVSDHANAKRATLLPRRDARALLSILDFLLKFRHWHILHRTALKGTGWFYEAQQFRVLLFPCLTAIPNPSVANGPPLSNTFIITYIEQFPHIERSF